MNGWKKITSELARRFSLKSIITDRKITELQRELAEVREEVRILKEDKKQDDQIRNKKLGIQNNNNSKSDKLKDVSDEK